MTGSTVTQGTERPRDDDQVIEHGHRHNEVGENGIGQRFWMRVEARRGDDPPRQRADGQGTESERHIRETPGDRHVGYVAQTPKSSQETKTNAQLGT